MLLLAVAICYNMYKYMAYILFNNLPSINKIALNIFGDNLIRAMANIFKWLPPFKK